jgi:hypothetical protein
MNIYICRFIKILERYDSDNQHIQGECYYSIDDTQLFRVKHVLSYLEANRQVSFFLIILNLIGFLQAGSLISSSTKEDITFKD